MTSAIHEQLQSVAGVAPSNDWLAACRSHLSNTSKDPAASCGTGIADAILHQVLHADLRDVVRPLLDGDIATDIHPAPSSVLRRAMAESKADSTSASTSTSPRKVTLPANFRLLMQMEELLDVSLNAEARLSLGPASANSPSAVGNQSKRTLKMYLSDGHLPHVDTVAMEVAPIANLSVNSKAGLKLLLHGPIDIRLGVLMLNEGNTTVLGGSVQSMVDVQIKARAQAQRLAGVGVDPTVKALIWNPDTGIDDEGADEGEGESGDVARRRVTATGTMFGGVTASGIANFGPAAPAALPPPPLPAATAATVATVASRSTEDHDQSMPPPRSMAPNLYGQPNQLPQPSAKQAPQNTYGQTRPVPANAYLQPPQSTARARPTAPPQNTYAQPSQTPSSAPPRPSPAASSALTPLRNPTIAAAVATYSNPYAAKTKTTYATPRAPANNVAYPRTNNSQSSPDECTVDLTQDEPPVLLRPACPSSSSSHRALSFSDLWSMLEQARTDRDLYEANQSTIFLVQGKMTGPHRYFNIEKNRGTRSSSDEKYKYVMVIHFTGGDGGNTITTTVANALSQPYFCVGPTEMRKLSKLNRADADAKAREGGFAVQKELMELAQWEMKLNMTGDEFFSIVPFPRMDGDDAILELLRKSG